ncbi:hypothetical protein [Pedobacter sp. B4-66]|uniref:hypothetical protein n=1 Tax=Pedobacter sp. B4-66 TaxID=2817280 RepID=UPI001BDAAC6A|nr:hypothetical protein [Pedobacter sp. B4-66]
MKKLNLKDLFFQKGEVLTRSQLKNVLGGGGSGSGSGSGSGQRVRCWMKCPGDEISTQVPNCDSGTQTAQCGAGVSATCSCTLG